MKAISFPLRKVLTFMDQRLEETLITPLFIVFTSIVVMEVFRRFVLNAPSDWAEELARIIFIYNIYLASSLLVKRDKHIRVNVLRNFMSERMKLITDIIADICVAFVCVFVIYYSVLILKMQIETDTMVQSASLVDLNFKIAYAYMAIPLGWGLMLFRLIQRFVRTIKR